MNAFAANADTLLRQAGSPLGIGKGRVNGKRAGLGQLGIRRVRSYAWGWAGVMSRRTAVSTPVISPAPPPARRDVPSPRALASPRAEDTAASPRHWALTISRPCANVRRLIRRLAHLGGVHKRGANYSSRRGPRDASTRFPHEPSWIIRASAGDPWRIGMRSTPAPGPFVQ